MKLSGKRVDLRAGRSRHGIAPLRKPPASSGFTLIELVITLTLMTILTLGVIPLIKNTVKREREHNLREALREMREAIKEFHRDTVGMQCGGGLAAGNAAPQLVVDPRQKVVISDCTIFSVDNPDHYPPELETLTNGVSVVPRAGAAPVGGLGLAGSTSTATDGKLSATKKKVYLRQIPVDPMTGKAEWDIRSSYDSADTTSWGGQNIFDVRSKSDARSLNGEKYSDW